MRRSAQRQPSPMRGSNRCISPVRSALSTANLASADLWTNIVSKLPPEVLNELFPGAPGIADLELSDLLPLLDALGKPSDDTEAAASVLPVPPNKMDFNNLPEGSRVEFNCGRLLAPRIAAWYADHSDPLLADAHGQRFKEIYRAACELTRKPTEILERIYVAAAGPDFRMDAKRANAAYAMVSYFFDSCHIFEMPSPSFEDTDAAAN